jgi:hypothetical protein
MLAEAVDELLAMILICASHCRMTGSIFARRVISTIWSLMISIMLFLYDYKCPYTHCMQHAHGLRTDPKMSDVNCYPPPIEDDFVDCCLQWTTTLIQLN